MSWPYPRIVAHRGGGALAPENTLGAIRLGASLGFRGVEFDVRYTSDRQPVVIHDKVLERTTNGQGRVARTPYADIAALDAGAWFGARWRGEPLPRFEDTVRLCRELGLWANVEIKRMWGIERATGAAVARMARNLFTGAALTPVLSSFAIEALRGAKDQAPELPRGYLVDEIPEDWRDAMSELGCISLHCNYQTLTRRVLEEVHAAGYAVLVWTVNDPRDAKRLLEWGVDSLVTDALDLIGPDFR